MTERTRNLAAILWLLNVVFAWLSFALLVVIPFVMFLSTPLR